MRSLHVLVAEDNPLNQVMAVGALKRLGHTGVVVDDGEKALRALAKQQFDVVLMDIMMPNLDGLATLAAIRANEKSSQRHLPVVMATAHDLPGDRERLIEAGADGYVAKPVTASALQAELERVLGSTRRIHQ